MITFIRKKELLSLFNFSKSTLHNKINAGIFPVPLSMGERCVAWPDDQIEVMQAAYIKGLNDSELKTLVNQLIQARENAFSALSPSHQAMLNASKKGEK